MLCGSPHNPHGIGKCLAECQMNFEGFQGLIPGVSADSVTSNEKIQKPSPWHNNPGLGWQTSNDLPVEKKNKEAWPSIRNKYWNRASPFGGNYGSINSGSVISSSSYQNQGLETSQGSSAMQGQSTSTWSSNPNFNGLERHTWNAGNISNNSANLNSTGWSTLPPSLSMNNQGHNMQIRASSAGSDGNSMNSFTSSNISSMAWGGPASQGGGGIGRPPTTAMQLMQHNAGTGDMNSHNRSVPNNGASLNTSEPQGGCQSRGGHTGNPLLWQGVNQGMPPPPPPPGTSSLRGNNCNESSWSSVNVPGIGNANQNNRSLVINNQGDDKQIDNTCQQNSDVSSNWSVLSGANNGNTKKNTNTWDRAVSPATSVNTEWSNAAGQRGVSNNQAASNANLQGQWNNTTANNNTSSNNNSNNKNNINHHHQVGGGVVGGGVGNLSSSNPNPKPQPSTWAQAAGKGLNTSASSNSNSGNPAAGNNGSRSSITAQREEIKRLIESNEGWGSRPIRQDSTWVVQFSPKSKRKFEEESNVWNNGSSNGTAIWEGTKDGTAIWYGTAGRPGTSGYHHETDNSGTWVDKSNKPPSGAVGTSSNGNGGSTGGSNASTNNPVRCASAGISSNNNVIGSNNVSNNNVNTTNVGNNTNPTTQVNSSIMSNMSSSGSSSSSSNNAMGGSISIRNNVSSQPVEPQPNIGSNNGDKNVGMWSSNGGAGAGAGPGNGSLGGGSGGSSSSSSGSSTGGGSNMGGGNGQAKNWNKTETGSWNASHSNANNPSANMNNKGPKAFGHGGSGWEEPSPPSQRRQVDNGTSYWGDPTQQPQPQNWNSIPQNSSQKQQLQLQQQQQQHHHQQQQQHHHHQQQQQQQHHHQQQQQQHHQQQQQQQQQRQKDDTQWNKVNNPKQQNSGWGEPVSTKPQVDDGTSIWAPSLQQQARSNGWDTSGTQWGGASMAPKHRPPPNWNDNDISTWNPQRKTGSLQQGWNDDSSGGGNTGGDSLWHDADMGTWNEGSQDNSSWSSASGWKPKRSYKGANKFPGGANQAPQMRVKLLQQLTDMGFKRDDAQTALISNNMNYDSALADLRQGATTMKKDNTEDVFQGDTKRKLSGMVDSSSGLNDEISDNQSESGHFVPNISMQNTSFQNAQNQLSGQSLPLSLKPGSTLPQPGMTMNPGSQNASLQQKLMHKLNQQQQQQSQQQQQQQQQQMQQQQQQSQQVSMQMNHHHQQQPQQQPQVQSHPQPAMNSSQGPVGGRGGNGTNTSAGGAGGSTGTGSGGGTSASGTNQLPTNNNTVQQQMAQHQILQQLRMAVQAGLISPQLLNQQLPPPMLVLLQQLLQMQSGLQQLVTRQQILQQQSKGGGCGGSSRQQMDQTLLTISRFKHQMLQLQQQIAQAQQNLPKPATVLEPIEAFSPLQNDMANLAISTCSQSRLLNQWKRPSPEKDANIPDNMMNKAVGSKPVHHPMSSSNLGRYDLSLGLSDSTWSNVPTTSSQNWPNVSPIGTNSQAEQSKDNSEVKESQSASSSSVSGFNLNDMIPEFVPGKPWQGITGAKSVEDDPYITPGSFSRSLSVNTIKDDYLTNFPSSITKSSPIVTSEPSGGTWPMKDFPKTSNSSQPIVGGGSQKSWTPSESVTTPTSFTSEVWGVPLQPKSSGNSARPPPGLAHNKTTSTSTSNWSSNSFSGSRQASWSGRSNEPFTSVPSHLDQQMARINSSASWAASTWLVLRNLTPQIDGSTLKTLCQQHGPLQFFYLILNHGQALVRYSSKDEAIKAQKALNTCVLGNTTILAEFVSEREANHLVEQSSTTTATPPSTSQWSQSSQSDYRPPPPPQPGAPPQYSSRNENTHWNMPASVSFGGFPGNAMWNASLWGGVQLEDPGSAPLLGNILGGDSM